MAKGAVSKKENGGGALTTSADNELERLMREDRGAGTSQRQEDNILPLIYVLQAQSPQVNKRSPSYIEGAEPGSIYLRNDPEPIMSEMLFISCGFSIDVVEWVPRDKGGGYVARHEFQPNETIADLAKRLGGRAVRDSDQPNRINYVTGDGNELQETRYHAGLVLDHGPMPIGYVIPFSGSGHSVSRQWMTLMNRQVLGDGTIQPSFSVIYRIKTAVRSNVSGEWFVLDPHLERRLTNSPEDVQLYLMARALNRAWEGGAKRAAAPEQRDLNTAEAEKHI